MGSLSLQAGDVLLVVDMQNSFLHPDGAMHHPPRGGTLLATEDTIERTAQAVHRAQTAGVPVVYTRHTYRPAYQDAGPATMQLFDLMGARPLAQGSWDAEIVQELRPDPGALIVDKSRFDAFYNTDLELLLRGLAARRLVITGIVTNVCVESTARSAFMRDFEVTILHDCCTTYTEEHQAVSLDALQTYGIASVAGLDG